MKYHDRSGCKVVENEGPEEVEEKRDDEKQADEETENGRRTWNEASKKDLQGPSNARKESVKHDARCVAVRVGANATLDFTLNCNSVRLTTRDTSSKTASRCERQERPEMRS